MSNPVTTIQKIGSGLVSAEHFFLKAFNDARRVESAIASLTPENKATFARVLTDITAAVSTAGAAAQADGLNLTLDAATVTSIFKLVSDARQGITEAKIFFETFGITV